MDWERWVYFDGYGNGDEVFEYHIQLWQGVVWALNAWEAENPIDGHLGRITIRKCDSTQDSSTIVWSRNFEDSKEEFASELKRVTATPVAALLLEQVL